MNRIKGALLTSLASAFIALQLLLLPVGAQSGSGLQIQPPRQELTIERGEASSFNVTLKNISDQPVIAKYVVNDFESDGVSGDPKIIVDSNVVSDASIRDFLVELEDVTLDANETKTFSVTAQIPEAAVPGAYYGLIRYQAIPLDAEGQELDGTQFSLNASLGILVLIDVPGNVVQGAEVESITAQSQEFNDNDVAVGEPSDGSFFMSSPDQIAINIKNTGGSFIKPFGKVIVNNMFGGESASYELNAVSSGEGAPAVRGNILPDSSRTFTNRVDIGGIGRYTVQANISYTQGGEVITRTSTFWVIPVWFIALTIALLAIVTFGGYRLYKIYLG